jgi:lactate permease
MVGRILALFCLIVPFWVIGAMCGRRRMLEIWPACLTAGVSFGITQFAISNFVGPSLAAIGASVVSMISRVTLLKFWQPSEMWSLDHEDGALRAAAHANRRSYSAGEKARAWMRWVRLSIFVFAWVLKPVKDFLNSFSTVSTTFRSCTRPWFVRHRS